MLASTCKEPEEKEADRRPPDTPGRATGCLACLNSLCQHTLTKPEGIKFAGAQQTLAPNKQGGSARGSPQH